MSETEEEVRKRREEIEEQRARDCEEARRRRDAAQREFDRCQGDVDTLEARKRDVVSAKESTDTKWSNATDTVPQCRDAVQTAESVVVGARHDRTEASQAYEQAKGDYDYAHANPGVIGWDLVTTTDRKRDTKIAFENADEALTAADRELADRKTELAKVEGFVESLVADRERSRADLGTVDGDLGRANALLKAAKAELDAAQAAVDRAC